MIFDGSHPEGLKSGSFFAGYYELPPEKSSFHTIVADITHRCNMACANCYIPNRKIKDMDFDRFQDLLRRLPQRTEIRLVGAEPTMRADLPSFIRAVRSAGHRPILLTNGLKLKDASYLASLRDAGLRTVYLSMNGADDDSLYALTDNARCASLKMAALKNLSDQRFKVGVGCILQRGANETAPYKLYTIINRIGDFSIALRFRNVGQLGRFSQPKKSAYAYSEVKKLLRMPSGSPPSL